jgi:cyanate permease
MEQRWQALAVLTAARTSMGFQFQSLAAASPVLVPDLGLGYADLGTLIGLYFLPGIVIALPGGALGRRFGDRNVVALGLVLMALGGLLSRLADGFALLAAGRLIAGIGAVLLNVLMAKMITDWFAGREIVLAMGIFVNSFPIGVGLAVMVLGGVATALGWPAALGASTAFALAALALLLLAYRCHPNDGAGAVAGGPALPRAVALLVSLAGAIWGIFNGAFSVMVGFAPTFLPAAGLSTAEAGVLAGAATWLCAASIQTGAIVAQRWGYHGALMALGALGWAACFATLALGGPPAPAMIAAGLISGLPVGVIMALPSLALRPEQRAIGMGLFYLWLYIGHSLLPPLAGWLQDRAGTPAAALWFAAALTAVMLPFYGLFRAGLGRATAR